MTLKDQIAADSSSVFLNTDEFAETVLYFQGGVTYPTAGIQVAAVVDEALRDAMEDVRGDGRHADNGKEIRRQATIELPVSVGASDTRTPLPDLIRQADGTTWAIKRILGRDADIVTVLAVRNDKINERHPRMKNG